MCITLKWAGQAVVLLQIMLSCVNLNIQTDYPNSEITSEPPIPKKLKASDLSEAFLLLDAATYTFKFQ